MKSKNLSENIIKNLKSKGFKNIVLDSVIETKYILRRSGENFRKFLFTFQDLKGNLKGHGHMNNNRLASIIG